MLVWRRSIRCEIYPSTSNCSPTSTPADFYTWAMETARALRERRSEVVDWDSVAEELEDMGRSEKRELTNRLAVLLTHLLKWQVQPPTAALEAGRSPSWNKGKEPKRSEAKTPA